MTNKPSIKRFRFHLQELMRQYGLQRGEVLSASELARSTGLTYPTIQKLRRQPVIKVEATTVAALKEFFHISDEQLYMIEDAPPRKEEAEAADAEKGSHGGG